MVLIAMPIVELIGNVEVTVGGIVSASGVFDTGAHPVIKVTPKIAIKIRYIIIIFFFI